MDWLSLSLPILLLVLSVSSADDTLTPGKALSGNQTLVSAGGDFALGFFSPGGGSNRYLGIWYNIIPDKAVVWVANRGIPLTDPATILTMTPDRNIAVINSNGSTAWSSAASAVPNGATAVLLDSGNLVLRQRDGTILWQSFDHPTDTLLPGMSLRSNYKTGVAQRIVAWRDAGDPSPGNFSFGIDPRTSLQVITWRGSEPYWRSHVWNGVSLSGRDSNATAPSYVLKVSRDSQDISITFSPSARVRYVLDPAGRLEALIWLHPMGAWVPRWWRPRKFCDPYNRCGPSGTCDSSGGSPTCGCVQGFVPRNQTEWDGGDFSGGCVRRVQLRCDMGDKFLRAERMKLPDRLTLVSNRTKAQCQAECLHICQCTAYAYANVSAGPDSSSCLLWVGELMDLEKLASGGEDLNVRLGAYEMGTDKEKALLPILLPSLAGGVLLGVAGYFLKRRTGKQRKREHNDSVPFAGLNVSNTLVDKDTAELPFMDYSTIVAATNNFSAANKLGEGGFGPVYKGTFSQDHEIAVKRLSRGSGQGFQEFKNEVDLIARLQHTNLVRLLGWCTHEDEKLLIYEYLPNKSLDKFIFDPSRSPELDWGKRLHIINGIAQGLLYLHRYSRLRVIHRDLKTSNILLDGAMNPKISDFGLARIFGGNETEAKTSRVVGTHGYMSPEYALYGLFSEKSDVFSFGVIVLEIITGKRSTGFYPYKESLNLLGYAWQLWEEGRALELVDSSVDSSVHAPQVVRCIQVGLLCMQENAAERPTMSLVVSMLSNENASMPQPKHPALATGRHPSPATINSSSSPSKESINELTVSVVEGR